VFPFGIEEGVKFGGFTGWLGWFGGEESEAEETAGKQGEGFHSGIGQQEGGVSSRRKNQLHLSPRPLPQMPLAEREMTPGADVWLLVFQQIF
jgi:hypothetical protein